MGYLFYLVVGCDEKAFFGGRRIQSKGEWLILRVDHLSVLYQEVAIAWLIQIILNLEQNL